MIFLEPSPQPARTHAERRRVRIPGVCARRRGNLLTTSSNHLRVWVSEERARAALAKDFPGERVVSIGEERKSA